MKLISDGQAQTHKEKTMLTIRILLLALIAFLIYNPEVRAQQTHDEIVKEFHLPTPNGVVYLAAQWEGNRCMRMEPSETWASRNLQVLWVKVINDDTHLALLLSKDDYSFIYVFRNSKGTCMNVSGFIRRPSRA